MLVEIIVLVVSVASVPQKLRYGNKTGVLMHTHQGTHVHENSRPVTITSVDSIVHEFTLRSTFDFGRVWQLPYPVISN